MMILRRPVSSPGRVEKYPPPLMGFLRSKSNGGSRSRRSRSRSKGRSRASPMFVRRNKSAAAVTQEPSSPKVTCMGQVRIKPKPEDPTRKKCDWIRILSERLNTMSFRPNWCLLPCSCRKSSSCRKKPKEKEKDSPTRTKSVVEIREEEREDFKIPKLVVSPVKSPVTSTPPMNAFLLTRSRSAPYGSSSLAFKFWEENKQREQEEEEEEARKCRSENLETEVSGEKLNVFYDEEGFVRRPELMRSKSEPARVGEKKMVLLLHG